MVQSDYPPEQVKRLLEEDAIELVDVREPHEYDAGRIAGARHIPLDELSQQAETIGQERPVVFYCRSGARSAMATQALRASGWDAHNMAGGLVDWAAAGLPLEPDGGHVADH